MRTQLSITAALAAAASLAVSVPRYTFFHTYSALHDRHVVFDWDTGKVRGVNIGGWLVLEPFITPSISEQHSSADWPVHDEWTLCEKLGQSSCADVLKPHWDNFVSWDDFRKIKDAGFNIVRIPVGYWR